jgi:hypothetical protein
LCHPANTVVVAQIKQAKIKIQIVLKLPLNPKSALKPLASFVGINRLLQAVVRKQYRSERLSNISIQ